jgi:hypothetical protein
LQACKRNNAGNCGLTINDLDKEIALGLPWAANQSCRVPRNENCGARRSNSRLELRFVPRLPEQNVRPFPEREGAKKHNNDFSATATAADHEASKFEV